MKNPRQATGRAVISTFDKGNYSLTAVRWHYIHYAAGAEELYDSESDPHEWTNLAGQASAISPLSEMRATLARLLKETGGH